MYGALGSDATETPKAARRTRGLLAVVVAAAAVAGAVVAVTIRRSTSAEPELIQSDGAHRYVSKVPKPPPMPSPGTDPKPPAIEVGKELDAYGNVIPADCKTWYDGCNTCRAMEGGFHSCTRKLCTDKFGAAKCLDETGHLNVYG